MAGTRCGSILPYSATWETAVSLPLPPSPTFGPPVVVLVECDATELEPTNDSLALLPKVTKGLDLG
jgi:hypothetical protein